MSQKEGKDKRNFFWKIIFFFWNLISKFAWRCRRGSIRIVGKSEFSLSCSQIVTNLNIVFCRSNRKMSSKPFKYWWYVKNRFYWNWLNILLLTHWKGCKKHRCLLCTELGGSNLGLKEPGPFEWEVSSPPEKFDCRSVQIAYRVEWN